MIIAKRLKGKAIAAWLGPAGDAARSAITAVKRTIRSDTAAPRLELYYEIADPWSYLAAQAVDRLARAYGVGFEVTVITPPASDVDPAPQLRPNHAARDAIELARYWDLDFPGKRSADPTLVRDIGTVLIRERPAPEQLACILELGATLWANDKPATAKLMGKYGTDAHMAVPPVLNENYDRLRKAGHYQGAMIQFAGEWYWGIDRLGFLEQAIAQATDRPVANVLHVRPEADRGALTLSPPTEKAAKPLTCEMWFSFRSPYSYLALQQIANVLAPSGIPLVLRPVQPMVTRGLQVPSVKRLYIMRDAKREADRLGIPFGEMCDPLGAGVDNCLAIAKWAEAQSPAAALAFARSATRGIWTEARDPAEYVDLKFVVERAGLSWEGARAALDDPGVAKWATNNAADLAVVGLWGVPSFRVGDFVTWGNDRLPLLVDRLRRHALAV